MARILYFPGFIGFLDSVNAKSDCTQILELRKSFKIIPSSNQFFDNRTGKIKVFIFLRGRLTENIFHIKSKSSKYT